MKDLLKNRGDDDLPGSSGGTPKALARRRGVDLVRHGEEADRQAALLPLQRHLRVR